MNRENTVGIVLIAVIAAIFFAIIQWREETTRATIGTACVQAKGDWRFGRCTFPERKPPE